MSLEANIIVHGLGGDVDMNRYRGIGAARLVSSYAQDAFEKIIFSGGKTYGADQPSEAEGMSTAFKQEGAKSSAQIILEESAFDTHMNATGSLNKIKDVRGSVILLLSSGWHLPRIDKIYDSLGVENRILVNTDALLDPEMLSNMRRNPYYWNLVIREPLARLLEHPDLRGLKRLITSRRIKKNPHAL